MKKKEFDNGVEMLWGQLEQLETASMRRIIERVAEMRKDVLDRLAEVPAFTSPDGSEAFSPTYLQAYEQDLRRYLQQWAEETIRFAQNDVAVAAQLADEGYRDLLTKLAASSGVTAPTIVPLGLSEDLVKAAAMYTASNFHSMAQSVASTVAQEIQAVAFGGQSRWDAIRNIRQALATGPVDGKTLGSLTKKASNIERTALVSVYNAATAKTYSEAAKHLPGMMKEWSAAHQKNTCSRCRGLDGKRVKVDGHFESGVFAPPLHFSCRCRIVAWMPDWE